MEFTLGHPKFLAGLIIGLIAGSVVGGAVFYLPNTLKPKFLPNDWPDDIGFAVANAEAFFANPPLPNSNAIAPTSQVSDFVSTVDNVAASVSSSSVGQAFGSFADNSGLDSSQSFAAAVTAVSDTSDSGSSSSQMFRPAGGFLIMSYLAVAPSGSRSVTGYTSFAYDGGARSFYASPALPPPAPNSQFNAPPPPSATQLQPGQVFVFQGGQWVTQSLIQTAQQAAQFAKTVGNAGFVWSPGTTNGNQISPTFLPNSQSFTGQAPSGKSPVGFSVTTTTSVAKGILQSIQSGDFKGAAQSFVAALGQGLIRWAPANLVQSQNPGIITRTGQTALPAILVGHTPLLVLLFSLFTAPRLDRLGTVIRPGHSLKRQRVRDWMD